MIGALEGTEKKESESKTGVEELLQCALCRVSLSLSLSLCVCVCVCVYDFFILLLLIIIHITTGQAWFRGLARPGCGVCATGSTLADIRECSPSLNLSPKIILKALNLADTFRNVVSHFFHFYLTVCRDQ